jgi:ribonuclease D
VAPILEDRSALEAFLASGAAGNGVAIDTEADSLHRYRESLCLIQFARGSECVLIDPLAITDLSPLVAYLAGTEAWMHGADYDMTMLQRAFGSLPPAVWDTQIAARLLGMRRFGLADLVEHYFGVKLSKGSQKADWGRRPLSPDMIEYALNDVRYLLPMGERVVAELQQRGRHAWFVESCQAARQRVLERDDSRDEAWRVRGSGKLDRVGLAFLRELWHWRDLEAKNWDRPSFMVTTNRELIEWSASLAAGRRIDLPHHYRQDRVRRFREAVERVRALTSTDLPDRPRGKRRKRNSSFDQRLDALVATRDRRAHALDIEPSLIAPRSSLEQIAAEEADPDSLLLDWQRGLLGLNPPA